MNPKIGPRNWKSGELNERKRLEPFSGINRTSSLESFVMNTVDKKWVLNFRIKNRPERWSNDEVIVAQSWKKIRRKLEFSIVKYHMNLVLGLIIGDDFMDILEGFCKSLKVNIWWFFSIKIVENHIGVQSQIG